MKQLAKERTGANDMNSFYKLNPQVSDLPDKLAKEINGVKLLVMGTVDTGGSGCVCPEHVMLKAILTSLTFRKDDVVIMDMEAGLEHLGRGTASMRISSSWSSNRAREAYRPMSASSSSRPISA